MFEKERVAVVASEGGDWRRQTKVKAGGGQNLSGEGLRARGRRTANSKAYVSKMCTPPRMRQG